MSRDMKPRKTPPRTKSGGGTLLGLFIGLVVGVVVVAGVVWYVNKVPLPFTTTGQQPKLPAPVSDAPTPPANPAMPELAPAPVALPGKPGDSTAPEKPRFDFYKILPGNAEAIPDPTQAQPAPGQAALAPATERKAAESLPAEVKPAETTRADREPTLKQPIYLQAGSFQSVGEADNQKARLALLGAEARIQQVMLQDKVWYRVRLGPYQRMDDVNALRAELARQGIDVNVVKKD
ncbi:MAG: SPOR domain-containing protein [Candidatus Accumulibacter sp.]|nr:SPOR domain-containing protein [Paracoccaceae bacterium]MCB1941350.1 SPOR domain-containing protein [Accumulibacter sp.]MCP5248365.1 SPOR domain-containing protein [Accumulibacter sp.]